MPTRASVAACRTKIALRHDHRRNDGRRHAYTDRDLAHGHAEIPKSGHWRFSSRAARCEEVRTRCAVPVLMNLPVESDAVLQAGSSLQQQEAWM
jgi:hypothetical protein